MTSVFSAISPPQSDKLEGTR